MSSIKQKTVKDGEERVFKGEESIDSLRGQPKRSLDLRISLVSTS